MNIIQHMPNNDRTDETRSKVLNMLSSYSERSLANILTACCQDDDLDVEGR